MTNLEKTVDEAVERFLEKEVKIFPFERSEEKNLSTKTLYTNSFFPAKDASLLLQSCSKHLDDHEDKNRNVAVNKIPKKRGRKPGVFSKRKLLNGIDGPASECSKKPRMPRKSRKNKEIAGGCPSTEGLPTTRHEQSAMLFVSSSASTSVAEASLPSSNVISADRDESTAAKAPFFTANSENNNNNANSNINYNSCFRFFSSSLRDFMKNMLQLKMAGCFRVFLAKGDSFLLSQFLKTFERFCFLTTRHENAMTVKKRTVNYSTFTKENAKHTSTDKENQEKVNLQTTINILTVVNFFGKLNSEVTEKMFDTCLNECVDFIFVPVRLFDKCLCFESENCLVPADVNFVDFSRFGEAKNVGIDKGFELSLPCPLATTAVASCAELGGKTKSTTQELTTTNSALTTVDDENRRKNKTIFSQINNCNFETIVRNYLNREGNITTKQNENG